MLRKNLLVIGMLLLCAESIFAGQLGSNENGSFYIEDDGSIATSKWLTLDLDNDGRKEYYYFNEAGIMLVNTTTPDGYEVNEKGQWTEMGLVKYFDETTGESYSLVKSPEEYTDREKEILKYAKTYYDACPWMSSKGIRDMLIYHNFTEDEASLGITLLSSNYSINWKQRAVKAARYIRTYGDYTANGKTETQAIERELIKLQFSREQAKYGSKYGLGILEKQEEEIIIELMTLGMTQSEAERALEASRARLES